MKRTGSFFSTAALVFLALFLMAMGSAGSPGMEASDSPFNAKIRDTSNNEVSLTSVTFDGKTMFNLIMGKGRVEIPFENISRIELKDGSVCIYLKGAGTMCNLKINTVSKIYGKMPYGMYQIALKDVAWIEFAKAKQ